MSIITTERLTKILSETQAVISECNSRGVHGSVEVNARLFENVLMELLRHRAAMLQGAGGKPELTVWYGSMPESNGKANWTAILHRKGEGRCMDGFTIDRSEYPGRVLYAADRVRYLIGEKSERPSILDYDADAHSGYVKTGNSPVIPDEVLSAIRKVARIRADFDDFDGDRRGIGDCLDEAEQELIVTINKHARVIAAAPQQEA
ncbi:TPA: hypothetical protein ACJIWV_002879 [Enterobacter asburiae]